MKFYKTSKLHFGAPRIDEVEAERVTEHFVWINGRRSAKHSDWDQFFPTWQEAHAFLLERAESRVIAARRSLEQANGNLGNVKGMREPA